MHGPEADHDPDAFIAFEAAGWERQAEGYGGYLGRITQRLVPALLDAAQVTSGSRVLDLATGPGYAATAAAERGAEVVGVDVAPAMVALAQRAHPALDFRVADVAALPFPAASFDAVISNFVVPHLGRPEQAVSAMARLLDTGGRLALTTWDLPSRMRLLGVFLEAFAQAGAPTPAGLPTGPPFFRFAADAEFAALLTGAGLADIDIAEVAFEHHSATADEIWDGLMQGTVRTSALMDGQSVGARAAVRAAFDEGLEPYRHDGGYELPIAVKLASGRRVAS